MRDRTSSPVISSEARNLLSLYAVAACCLFLAGCSWFTDFKEQPKIDPWESPDTIPYRANPQSSVSIFGTEAPGFIYDRSPTPAAIQAMAGLKNPVAPDSASINRGRLYFQINCSVCHGTMGMGDGPVNKYGGFAPSIGKGSRAADSLTDGYIFGMIRNGRGMMPTYNRIEEPNRWDIVNYLRTLQGKGPIPADTAHGRPGETGTTLPPASETGPTRPSPYFGHTPTMVPAPSVAPAAGARADSTKKQARP